MRAILDVILLVLDLYTWVIIASAIFSWLYAFGVVNPRNQLISTIGRMLYQLTEPALRPDAPLRSQSRRARYQPAGPAASDLPDPADHCLLRLPLRVLIQRGDTELQGEWAGQLCAVPTLGPALRGSRSNGMRPHLPPCLARRPSLCAARARPGEFRAETVGEVVLVAMSPAEQVLGFTGLQLSGSFVHHLYVDPRFHRCGVGRALLPPP
jgi:hypothetical protein